MKIDQLALALTLVSATLFICVLATFISWLGAEPQVGETHPARWIAREWGAIIGSLIASLAAGGTILMMKRQIQSNRVEYDRDRAFNYAVEFNYARTDLFTFVVEMREMMWKALDSYDEIKKVDEKQMRDLESRFAECVAPTLPDLPHAKFHSEIARVVFLTSYMARKWTNEWKNPAERAGKFSTDFQREIWGFGQMEEYATRAVFLIEQYVTALIDKERIPTDDEVRGWLSADFRTYPKYSKNETALIAPSLYEKYNLQPHPKEIF